ncbi:MAG: hypothetical protein FWG64_03190 [Firmicutes bacterium]|nr:hypothetical protein [Bacillota bacterium]
MDKLLDFFSLKTVVTLALIFTLCYMTIQGNPLSNDFIFILTAVVTYYFAKRDLPQEENNLDE